MNRFSYFVRNFENISTMSFTFLVVFSYFASFRVIDQSHGLVPNSSHDDELLGYVVDFLNLSPSPCGNLYYTEFDVDSESGLQIDLRGRKSEHKSFFHISIAMRRYAFFKAL